MTTLKNLRNVSNIDIILDLPEEFVPSGQVLSWGDKTVPKTKKMKVVIEFSFENQEEMVFLLEDLSHIEKEISA